MDDFSLDSSTISRFFGDSSMFTYMTNLLGEFGEIEGVLISVIAVGLGILISGSAVLDVIKMKNPRYAQKISPGSVASRMIFGPVMILIIPFMTAINESIFGERNGNTVPRSMTYHGAATSTEDPLLIFLLALVGFLVFVGWVTAIRAVMAFARCGNPQENGYQLAKAGGARLIAASFLTMFQFVLDDIFAAATGTANMMSSKLNL